MEYYLPLFLWNVNCQREGKNPFWELLKILSKADADVFDLKTEKENEVIKQRKNATTQNNFIQEQEMNKKQCLYCGEDFKGERGLNLHFKSFAKTTHNFKFQ